MRRAILIAVVLCFPLVAQCANAGDVHDNERIIEEAAASLEFLFPENRAYMLEKHSDDFVPFWPKLAVIFGYSDNRAACEEIANAMYKIKNADRRPDETPYEFECAPIDRK